MDRQDLLGSAQLAGGGYLGYLGVKHGLPRALGIRIENHTTSKTNADLIKKAGSILDPSFGGKGGWSEKVKSSMFVNHSTGYVHITGVHKDTFKSMRPKYGFLKAPASTVSRVLNNFMYKTVGNGGFERLKSLSKKDEIWKNFSGVLKENLLNNKTKKFYISGIDSYFNKNFIPDSDSNGLALKTTRKLKVYNNRFSATLAGLEKFGLKGMKENKGRVGFGLALISLGIYCGAKLINKGLNNISTN